jgi:hypothetical protein
MPDKPTPESGNKATARQPMGTEQPMTPTASGAAESGGYPLRPDSAHSSLLPASQVSSGE